MPERPNIVLIVLDTARADAFTPYGADPGASPTFADLARSGELHRQMHASACWTVPSHASMFTGLLPREAGLARAPGGVPRGCAAELEARRDRLLPVVMAAAGYETTAVSTNLWISERSGFDLGFEHFHTVDGGRQGSLESTSRRQHLRWLYGAARARADDGAAEAGRVIDASAAAASGRPFFWFANLVEAHSPYMPPRPFNPLGPADRLRAAEEARRHLTTDEIWRACAGGFDVPAAAIERMKLLYAASIKQLDAWLAQLLERLDARRLLDETLVIVTADHGENLGENGLMAHAYSLDQRLTHVPFVCSGPGAPPEDGVSSLAELPRMISEAAGIEGHPYGRDACPPGIAVAQFDPPAGPEHEGIPRVLKRWGLGEEAVPRFTSRLTSATDGRWKLVRAGREERFFDLDRDPLECEPLDGELPAAIPAAALRSAVAGAVGEDDVDRSAEPAVEISDAERARLEERMRLLGYL